MRAKLFLVLLALPLAAWAQVPLTESEAVRLGLGRDALTDLERSTLRAAEADVRAAGLYPNPTLTYSRERVGGNADSLEQSWMLEQTVDLSGRRTLRRESASRRVDATRAENTDRQVQRAAAIRRSFHAALRQQASVRATEAWVQRFARIEDIVVKLRRAGEASGYDLRRLARERQSADASLAKERADLERELARLMALAGVTHEVTLEGALLPPPLPPDNAALARIDEHPALRALARRVEAAELDARAAQRGVFPEVTVGAGPKFVESRGTHDSGVAFSVSVPLPVFDRQQAVQQRALAEAQQLRAHQALLKAQLAGELRGLYHQAESLRQAASAYRDRAQAATPELLRIAEKAYQGGESTLLELLDAYRGALDTETTALDLEWRARDARIEYDLISGNLP